MWKFAWRVTHSCVWYCSFLLLRMSIIYYHILLILAFKNEWEYTQECVRVRMCYITCVTWLIYVCHDSFIRVTWLTHVWRDSFICVTRLIHMWDMTHSYVGHDSFICGTRLIHMWDVIQSYVWLDSLMCVISHIFSYYTHECVRSCVWISHMWMIRVTDMNESRHTWVSHDTRMNESRHTWISHNTHVKG